MHDVSCKSMRKPQNSNILWKDRTRNQVDFVKCKNTKYIWKSNIFHYSQNVRKIFGYSKICLQRYLLNLCFFEMHLIWFLNAFRSYIGNKDILIKMFGNFLDVLVSIFNTSRLYKYLWFYDSIIAYLKEYLKLKIFISYIVKYPWCFMWIL